MLPLTAPFELFGICTSGNMPACQGISGCQVPCHTSDQQSAAHLHPDKDSVPDVHPCQVETMLAHQVLPEGEISASPSQGLGV